MLMAENWAITSDLKKAARWLRAVTVANTTVADSASSGSVPDCRTSCYTTSLPKGVASEWINISVQLMWLDNTSNKIHLYTHISTNAFIFLYISIWLHFLIGNESQSVTFSFYFTLNFFFRSKCKKTKNQNMIPPYWCLMHPYIN